MGTGYHAKQKGDWTSWRRVGRRAISASKASVGQCSERFLAGLSSLFEGGNGQGTKEDSSLTAGVEVGIRIFAERYGADIMVLESE